MNTTSSGWALIVSCALVGQVSAASFDCARSKAVVEKIICADDELSKLDDELVVTYRAAQQSDGKSTKAVQQAQRGWLKERNRCTDRGCLLGSYTYRLWQLASPDPAHSSATGMLPLAPSRGEKSSAPSRVGSASLTDQPMPRQQTPSRPDPGRYKQEVRLLEQAKKLFLSHVDRARNVSIPYVPAEFPWRIDWDKQQAYCQAVWNALTTERDQRLRFFVEPTASVYRDGEEAYRKAWRGLKFERGCFDEFPFGHVSGSMYWPDRDFSLYDHSPDWIVELWPRLNSLKTGRNFLGGSRLIYAREPDDKARRCDTTTLGAGYNADELEGIPYDNGGIEDFFVLVDDKPLLLKFGIYVSAMDFSGIETETYIPGNKEAEASYFAWFGKRRGRIGQGFVAVQSHQTNLYRSLALESNGYKETLWGIVPDSERNSERTLSYASRVDYQEFVCVMNFDINEAR